MLNDKSPKNNKGKLNPDLIKDYKKVEKSIKLIEEKKRQEKIKQDEEKAKLQKQKI